VVHGAFYRVTVRRGVEREMADKVDFNMMVFKDEGGGKGTGVASIQWGN
jgi:hypothetical protein